MALRIDFSAAPVIRHVFARSRGRHSLYPDARVRAAAARQLADVCLRHAISCIVWCMTDRCLHVVARGSAVSLALATEELAGPRLRHGHALSTLVKLDLYLLEVARHALLSPVRGRAVPARDRLAVFERTAQLRIPSRACLARPDATLRVAGTARRPERRPLPPVHGQQLAARMEKVTVTFSVPIFRGA